MNQVRAAALQHTKSESIYDPITQQDQHIHSHVTLTTSLPAIMFQA